MYMRVFVLSMMLPYAALAATAASDSLIDVSLRSGMHVRGRMIAAGVDSLTILTTDGLRVRTARSAVVSVTPLAGWVAHNGALRPSRPGLTGSRLGAELLVGAATGAGVAIGAGMVSFLIVEGIVGSEEFEGELGGLAVLAAASPGLAIGYAIGVPLGVYMAGSYGDQGGSVRRTFAGSAAGLAIGVGACLIPGGFALLPLSPLVGAIVGFNSTRRWDESPAQGALFDVDGGGVALGAPTVTYRANPRDGTGCRDVTLVRMRF